MNRSLEKRLARLEPRRKGLGEMSEPELAVHTLRLLTAWVGHGLDDDAAEAVRHVAISHGLEVEPGEDPAKTWAATRALLQGMAGALEPA